MRKYRSLRRWFVLILMVLGFSILMGCNLPFFSGNDSEMATLDVTQAYETINAKLTQAIAQTPSVTSGPSATVGNPVTVTPSPTQSIATNTPAVSTATRQVGCTDLAAAGVPIDVTIPDDTQMIAGQPFTKTWRLQNIGTCTWTQAYALAFFSGEAMSAPASISLTQSVAPGQSVDLSVDMIAPGSPATYRGNWKLRSTTGELFGIGPNGGSPFWVQVVVVAGQTATATSGLPAATATTAVQASGSVNMVPGDRLDLDSAGKNTGDSDDLSYDQLSDGSYQLVALGSTRLGVFGNSQPSYADCRATSPSASTIPVGSLPAGTYLCYRTGLGLPGRALLSGINAANFTLSMEIITWSAP